MRRFSTLVGLAAASFAVYTELIPNAAHGQYVQVPVVQPYAPLVVQSSYPPPVIVNAPPVVSYYPQSAVTYSYYPPVTTYYPPTTTYYAPPPTYYAPTVVAPAPGIYTTRSYYGFGIFRPRGYYNQTTYTPYYYP